MFLLFDHSFLWLNNTVIWIYLILFICSFDGHLSDFLFLAILNNATINIYVHVFV